MYMRSERNEQKTRMSDKSCFQLKVSHKLGDKVEVCRNPVSKVNKIARKKEEIYQQGKKHLTKQQQQKKP